MKKNHWSCSRFADWLRGTANPVGATPEELDAWKEQAKRKRFRYWLAESGLDCLQNIICSPITLVNHIKRYRRN